MWTSSWSVLFIFLFHYDFCLLDLPVRHWWWICVFFLCNSVHVCSIYFEVVLLGTYKFRTVISFWWHFYHDRTSLSLQYFYVKVYFFFMLKSILSGNNNQTNFLLVSVYLSSESKESACKLGNLGSIPGSGRCPGEGNGYPLQYSCLENWGTWQTIVRGVAKSQTWLSD